jgi:FMN phosphatase YigB (HAD superfamily)
MDTNYTGPTKTYKELLETAQQLLETAQQLDFEGHLYGVEYAYNVYTQAQQFLDYLYENGFNTDTTLPICKHLMINLGFRDLVYDLLHTYP